MYKKILFLITLFFAIALRAQETLSHNFLFLIDQGRDMMAVKNIVYDHHLTLIGPYTSLGGIFQGPLWYYLLAVPTIIAGGDPWGAVVLMFFISVLTCVLAYIFMYRLFGFKTAIITFILFAVSPEAVAAATYSWNPHPNWLLVLVYFFSLYFVSKNKQRYHLILWPVIALMFHFETALGVFILLGTILYVSIFHRDQIKNKYFFLGLFLAGFFFLPQILFDIRHNFLMTKSAVAVIAGEDKGLIVKGEVYKYKDIVISHLSTFVIHFRSAFIQDGIYKDSPTYLFIILFVTFLISIKNKQFKKEEYFFIKTLFKISAIIFALMLFYPFPIRSWFLTGFQVLYILIAGLLLGKLLGNSLGKCILLGLLVVFLINATNKLGKLYLHPDYGGVAKVKGKIDAIDYIYKDANGKPFGLFFFTPPVYTFNYDYLLFYLGRTRYAYTPYKEKKGTFYLLIEPDPGKQWSYIGWLETVIKTGEIVETKTLPSGFIVQKRRG